MADTLFPSQVQYFAQQSSDAQFKKKIADAQNTYQRTLANQTFTQQSGDLAHQYGLARAQVPGGFIKRGVGNGGLYQQGLANFAYQGGAARNQLALQNELQNRGFNLTDTQANSILKQALNNITAQQTAARQDMAAQITAAQAYS